MTWPVNQRRQRLITLCAALIERNIRSSKRHSNGVHRADARVTVFSFGLFTFSSSARRADAVAADFEKRLNDADAKILSSERDLSKRLNGHIDTACPKSAECRAIALRP